MRLRSSRFPLLSPAFAAKLRDFNWALIFLLIVVACIGFAMLYSVADGSIDPWMRAQAVRFAIGLGLLAVVALVDLRIWIGLAYPAYFLALILLVLVDLFGTVGMGAQRWLDLGLFSVQPSELAKITLVLALARYYHGLKVEQVSSPLYLIPPALMIGAPVALVFAQPDLGTGVLLAATGATIVFLAGLSWRLIVPAVVAALAVIPVGWQFLHGYQKARILSFLDPESDPLGRGYHILQSKIALGSGGVFGTGFMKGTQSHLNFLPEKQTDFIFTMFAEEFGLIGCVTLLVLYLMVLSYGLSIAQRSRSHFGRLTAMGILVIVLLYVVINTSMVMGLIPVVGVPLPLVSYGGTAMMTIMFGFGLIMCVHLHRGIEVPRYRGLLW
jgi:rod shape determining protein RodA